MATEPSSNLTEQQLSAVSTLLSLALEHFQDKRFHPAVQTMHKCLQIFHDSKAIETNEYARSLNNLAFMLKTLKDYEGAQCLYERALLVRVKIFGETHQDVAVSLHNLAALFLARGKLEKALPLHDRVVAIRKSIFGEGSKNHLDSLHDLGLCLDALGRNAEAIGVFTEVLQHLQKKRDSGPDLLRCLDKLASCLESENDLATAKFFRVQAQELRAVLEAKKCRQDGADAMTTIASLHSLVGRADLGVPIFLRAHHLLKNELPPRREPPAVKTEKKKMTLTPLTTPNKRLNISDEDRLRSGAELDDASEPATPDAMSQWRSGAPEGLYDPLWQSFIEPVKSIEISTDLRRNTGDTIVEEASDHNNSPAPPAPAVEAQNEAGPGESDDSDDDEYFEAVEYAWQHTSEELELCEPDSPKLSKISPLSTATSDCHDREWIEHQF